ncbi:hypothetical protein BDR05DRAFT_1061294 [Suillus weaverae]|nr:hypothetical protein BDR05DRAFT_1061294 [Suillus weaverae]
MASVETVATIVFVSTSARSCLARVYNEGETQAKGRGTEDDDEAKVHPSQPHARPLNTPSPPPRFFLSSPIASPVAVSLASPVTASPSTPATPLTTNHKRLFAP